MSVSNRKLVLHFDVKNTIVMKEHRIGLEANVSVLFVGCLTSFRLQRISVKALGVV